MNRIKTFAGVVLAALDEPLTLDEIKMKTRRNATVDVAMDYLLRKHLARRAGMRHTFENGSEELFISSCVAQETPTRGRVFLTKII